MQGKGGVLVMVYHQRYRLRPHLYTPRHEGAWPHQCRTGLGALS
jgi:hypothetical protein